jgi:hypothetical protein
MTRARRLSVCALGGLGPDSSTQQFDQTIEGVIKFVGVRVPIASFEMTEPMERRAQCSGRVNSMVIIEIEPGKRLGYDTNDALDRFFEFGVAGAWISIGGLVQAGICQHGLSPCPADGVNRLVARDTNSGLAQRSGEVFAASQAKQSQEVLITLDVPIESGLTHAQFFGDACKCQRVKAFGISQRSGSRDDATLI